MLGTKRLVLLFTYILLGGATASKSAYAIGNAVSHRQISLEWSLDPSPSDVVPSSCNLLLSNDQPPQVESLSADQKKRVSVLARGFFQGERIFEPEIRKVFLPKGKPKTADHYIVIRYEGEPIISFFRFEKNLDGAVAPRTFAAVFGIGIVTLKKLVPADLEARGLSIEMALFQEKKLTEILQAAGIGVANHMAVIEDRENHYVINTYEPGPTLSDLYDLHAQNKISNEYWIEAEKKYEIFQENIKRARESEEVQKLLEEHKIYSHLIIANDDAVFVNGEWKVIQF